MNLNPPFNAFNPGFTFASATTPTAGASYGKQCIQCNSVSQIRDGESFTCTWCGWNSLQTRATYLYKLGVIPRDDPILISPPMDFGTILAPTVQVHSNLETKELKFTVECQTSSGLSFRPICVKIRLTDPTNTNPPRDVELRNHEFDLEGVAPGTYSMKLTVVHYRQESPPSTLLVTVQTPIPHHQAYLTDSIVRSVPATASYEDAFLVEMDAKDPECETVASIFHETTPKAQIFAIYKVRCRQRLDSYNDKRNQFLRRFQSDQSGSSINELQVWHGLPVDSIPKIIHQGFLRQFNVRGAFGHGSYFARDSKISVSYAKMDGLGFRHMFLCRILAGEYCAGKVGEVQPPLKNKHVPFDSTVNKMRDPTIHIIYGDDQAIPDFLISFKEA